MAISGQSPLQQLFCCCINSVILRLALQLTGTIPVELGWLPVEVGLPIAFLRLTLHALFLTHILQLADLALGRQQVDRAN